MPLVPITDVDALVRTRESLHAVGEHVLGAARRAATGRIGLVVLSGGFGTPPLPDGRVLAVDGVDLVDGARRAPITALEEAAAFFDTPLGMPGDLYPIATPLDPRAGLAVDARSAALLAAWFAHADELLRGLAESGPRSPTPQLWPEHFDLALELGEGRARATFGASPGDGDHAEPYLYVTPWEPRTDPFWNESTFASLPYGRVGEAFEFFATARRLLEASPG